MKTKIPKEGEMKSEWTDKDVNYLVKHHENQTADQMARHLSKTYDQVKAKLRRMGLKSLDSIMTTKNKKWQEFIENNKNVKGRRQIRLNKVTLIPKDDGFVRVIFVGDIHIGYPTSRIDKAQEMLDWALKTKTYVIGMGDYMECGLTSSIGDSVYQQKLNPQAQMEKVIEMFTPLAKAGLIIGMHSGNHENRIMKDSGIDVTKNICGTLNVPYLGYACWTLVKVGNQHYTIYSEHGCSGSKFKHTKLKAVMDLLLWIHADIVAMAHVHSETVEESVYQYIDLRSGTVKQAKCLVLLTGSYMDYDGSYGQAHNYPIMSLGSPKVKLSATEKDFHARV
jgi:hypothetical protein